MASKGTQKVAAAPTIGLAGYLFLAYWAFFVIIYFGTDTIIDLYEDKEYSIAFWYSAVFALPFAIGTIYSFRKSLFTNWYTYITYPLIIYGLYLASAYFTSLKLDMLISVATMNETEQVLPVISVERVIQRKQGFVYTDVILGYQNRAVTFVGTRTSYFLLKPYRSLHLQLGRSYLGSHYVTHIDIPSHARWTARKEYIKDWIQRRYFILALIVLIIGFGLIKDKYFPSLKPTLIKPKRPYIKVLKRLFLVVLILFGAFMLVLLLVGLFA